MEGAGQKGAAPHMELQGDGVTGGAKSRGVWMCPLRSWHRMLLDRAKVALEMANLEVGRLCHVLGADGDPIGQLDKSDVDSHANPGGVARQRAVCHS